MDGIEQAVEMETNRQIPSCWLCVHYWSGDQSLHARTHTHTHTHTNTHSMPNWTSDFWRGCNNQSTTICQMPDEGDFFSCLSHSRCVSAWFFGINHALAWPEYNMTPVVFISSCVHTQMFLNKTQVLQVQYGLSIKEIVRLKFNYVIIYSPLCHSKPVWLSFSSGTQKEATL